jgi:hypothetical protein
VWVSRGSGTPIIAEIVNREQIEGGNWIYSLKHSETREFESRESFLEDKLQHDPQFREDTLPSSSDTAPKGIQNKTFYRKTSVLLLSWMDSDLNFEPEVQACSHLHPYKLI